MDSKFTKGKWKINTPNDSNGYQVIKCEDGLNIATCFGVLERTIPNAKLIESAPEMFEMLKEKKKTICRLRLSMSVHPDCKEGSEFADYVDLADSTEIHLEQLLTKITVL